MIMMHRVSNAYASGLTTPDSYGVGTTTCDYGGREDDNDDDDAL